MTWDSVSFWYAGTTDELAQLAVEGRRPKLVVREWPVRIIEIKNKSKA